MEEKNVKPAITNREFLELLQAVKQKEADAMLKIIELFQEDFKNISKHIPIPKEDALSELITEFLTYLQC